MTMITPSYLGETIEYSSLHACRSTLEDPTVRRHLHADRDEVHVGMLDHLVRVGKSVGNSEMPGRFVCGFLAAGADRCDLELRKRAQGRNVGIAPPTVAHTCSNDANTDFFCRHDVFKSPAEASSIPVTSYCCQPPP